MAETETRENEEWYEKPLPKAPVPSLDHTLARYLEYARVVSGNNSAAVRRTEEAVTDFLKTGRKWQQKLEKIAASEENWINLFWLPEMYLKVRLSLPVNSSPAYIFPQQKFKSLNEQLNYTSLLIYGFCKYKDLIDRKKIPREMSTGRNKVQMCMEQYDRILRCYREPGFPTDIQHYKGAPRANATEHVLVMCSNQAFVLFTRLEGSLLSEGHILSQLNEIVRMSDNRPADAVIPIAGGSVGDRSDATAFWKIMKEVPKNEESLNWARSASFVVCVDRRTNPSRCSDDRETNLSNQGVHLLTGFGSKVCGLNRWYDATIQIVVANDGTNGLCIEHSVAEGIVIINMAEFSLRFVAQSCFKHNRSDCASNQVSPKALSWFVSEAATALLKKQIREFNELTSRLQLRVLEFTDFGKEFIKSCMVSPDGFVQLSMQLAHYRLHDRLLSTYESASIRRFRLGRVDNIRAATPEALLWVQTMTNKRKPLSLKRKLFEEAIKRQAEVTLENITGYGIDNHLCALSTLANEDLQQNRIEKLPDIFEDPLWAETMRFPLSTSQVTTSSSFENSYLCYGPVVKDGYGCSYNIQPNSIIFAPTALRGCPTTDVTKFKGALVESLRDMKMLLSD